MKINFNKNNGLVPAIIQDAYSGRVLMLGYMNQKALEKTQQEGKVTFFSRSRQKIWTKGETSGNYLLFRHLLVDCDCDTILIKASATGPVCHTGQDTCFNEHNRPGLSFLKELEDLIVSRKKNPREGSYTSKLFSEGIKKIVQKVGEETTEVVIDAVDGNNSQLKEETADLFYHILVMLAEREITLDEVTNVLYKRHYDKSE
jgi:phosphoribosyl-ATP pyrophosphohydrolase/phosphoribosyl-AMP cyclohydrolase